MYQSYELDTFNVQPTQPIIPQYLNREDSNEGLNVVNLGEELQQKVNIARNETKNLYSQVDKVKHNLQDANLFEMANSVEPLNSGTINLSPTITLKGHNNKIADFRWSRDSNSILSASQDGFLLLWDSATGLKKKAIPLDSQWVLSCAISPNGKLVASAGLNNNCTIYGVSGDTMIQQNVQTIFKGHTCYISDVDFMDNSNVLTASGDMTCSLWNIPKAKRVREFTDHLGDVLGLSISPKNGNQNIFSSCGSDGYAYIWDTRIPGATQHYFVSDCDVSTIQFFKDGNSIVTGSDDGTINIFDLRSDCPIASYSLQESLTTIKEQPTYTASTMEYGKSTTSPISTAVSSSFFDNQGVTSIDFSSSGRLMYVTYTDLGCVVWDILKANVVGKLEGHRDRVTRVRSSYDGMGVCTGSWDTTLRIWSPK
ncbi:similar to Saccharomyces cerevisiae YOR212W STE4 G protein beta subunit [Maudiozyma barnettii]|uniref:Similar to Saccharomyces cerevisiae YOR212W STE4 G protein beta subunit n=1 Tax=Maudiozyma barnettii TaxID=61262 RepID=A0A8H2ZIW1_9SACH|nr:G protein subunit beta [Kazachstania barnettii]CAB4253642.1 similar to Saccharomyces cerevisiae YOR212W STE4 G protein beta subunit [Kazachstania barnettii]CAD1781318.1 similar to Saccharomyces cerevisiae YOR212W STE4 G protein beta subunit [Kazachstania barnettii]